ncbi:dendrin isoform X1 [Ascaphus truei]|uniref:dendrin isoform X1 n=1 Tax=Ascaphus truei TaxID=8439 RepID=UPI003F5A5EBF
MDSRRWMDLDGEWVYSTAPRRNPDTRLKYRTLPGRDYETYRKYMDISRRPADERGMYGTVPGRFVDRGPSRDLSPYRLLSSSRLPQSLVLQDSTNRTPSKPHGDRGHTMVRMDQSTDTRVEAGNYEGTKERTRKNVGEQERKRRKLLREAELVNFSPSGNWKQRGKGKHMEADTVYGGWEPDYAWEQKMKVAKHDAWEPLARPPKALQAQLVSETPKALLNQLQPQQAKAKPAEINIGAPAQEKRRWWFKSQKYLKPGVSDVAAIRDPQEGSTKINVEQSLTSYRVHKQQGTKENEPQQRKRRGPPPYIPPPPYNSLHRIIPIKRDKHMHLRGSNKRFISEVVPLTDNEKYRLHLDNSSPSSWQHIGNSKLTLSSAINLKDDREGGEERQIYDLQTYQNIRQDRNLSRAYSTWGGLHSQWQGHQQVHEADKYLDHIYDIVEGGSPPITSNLPGVLWQEDHAASDFHTGELTYGTFSIPQQRDPATQNSYTLPRTGQKGLQGGNEVIKMTKRNKNIANGDQPYCSPSDVLHSPIVSHGVKLPHELGFSYTSGQFQYTGKKMRAEYTNSEEPDNDEQGIEWRRPPRVISTKDARVQSQSAPISRKGGHDSYSQTLPWKKGPRDQIRIAPQETLKAGRHLQMKTTLPVISTKQRTSQQGTIFPKWREPGKASKLQGRGHDQSHWRHHAGLKPSVKYSIPEPSKIWDDAAPRKDQFTETTQKKCQPSSTESEGMFVIDATCVVVRAEYIFPPRMEHVTFLSDPQALQGLTKEDMPSTPEHYENNVRDRNTSLHSSQTKSILRNTMTKSPPRIRYGSIAQDCAHLPTEREAPNQKERAVRILGLSVTELDSLNEVQGQHEMIETLFTGAVNGAQMLWTQEKEADLLMEAYNGCRGDKPKNCKEASCNMLENKDLPAVYSLSEGDREPRNLTPLVSNPPENQYDSKSEQNMIFSPVEEVTSEGKDHDSSSMERERLELIAINRTMKNLSGSVQDTNDFTASKRDGEACLAKESESKGNNSETTKSQCERYDSGCKKHQPMNEQLLEDTTSIPTSAAESIRETTNQISGVHLIERLELKDCPWEEIAGQTCVSEEDTESNISNDNGKEKKLDYHQENKARAIKGNGDHLLVNSGQMNSSKCAEHCQKSVHLTEHLESELPCMAPSTQRRPVLIPPTDQTNSPGVPVRSYMRRHNYFAKDLREAVSRIRRHTAPDSDTDEDELKKPLSDLGSGGHGVSVEEEAVTSSSCDTSDSEVSVILCRGEKKEQMSMSEDHHCLQVAAEVENGLSDVAGTTQVFVLEESPVGASEPDEIVDQSRNAQLLENRQEEGSLDLNSCIDEILQELSRTEQEFFPSSNDGIISSMITNTLDAPADHYFQYYPAKNDFDLSTQKPLA